MSMAGAYSTASGRGIESPRRRPRLHAGGSWAGPQDPSDVTREMARDPSGPVGKLSSMKLLRRRSWRRNGERGWTKDRSGKELRGRPPDDQELDSVPERSHGEAGIFDKP
jgi:hypothetical protein